MAALVVLGVLSAAAVGLTVTHRAFLTTSLDETLGDRADTLVQRLRAGLPVDSADLPTDDVVVQVVDGDGAVVVASRDAPHARVWPGTPRRTTVSDGTMPNTGANARVLATPAGDGTVFVAGTLEDVEASTTALRRSLLVAVPLSTLVLAALVWWLVGRVLRPVETIRAEVDRITASDLRRRVPEPPTTDEIARLAHTMNAMLGRLAEASEEQRRFVADAAHELRSPLARIRAQLEVDAAHPATADPDATRASVLAEAARLQRLVDDLLLLARGDAGALDPVRAGPVDLDDVVERLAAERRTGRTGIDTRGVRPVQVLGDEDQLGRAIANLLDNAVRHARSTVTVSLEERAGQAALTVVDDGPGIPAEQRDRVFERFIRLDDARSADGGAGLGLAIARDIARRHGGGLVIDGSAPCGAVLVFTLPGEGVSAAADPGRG